MIATPPRRPVLRWGLATALACLAGPAAARQQSLTVASASDMRFALDEALAPFKAAQRAGASAGAVSIEVIYGSTGKLATQIRHGAPFDLFLSAERSVAEELHKAGLTLGPPRIYAQGFLAAWSTDAAIGRLPLAELVRDARVRRFAIANPEHAPYGRRAMEALRSQGLADVAAPKLVLGENIAQAAQFVQSGAAQAGLVALSWVLAPALQGKGAFTTVPGAWHSPLEQAAVVLRRAAENAATLALAHAFIAHLETPATRATLRRYGFALPGETRP